MNNKLQIFIQTHRAAFDAREPGPRVWNGVERTLNRLRNAGAAERFVLLHRELLDTETPPELVWAKIEAELDGFLTAARDPLETFIHQHRADLDAATPNPRVWAEVERAVTARPAKIIRVHWGRHLMRAAAAIGLLVAGVGLGIWYAGDRGQNAGMALGDVSAEYAELEGFYQRDIAVKEEKLVAFTGNRGADVQEDLHQLDGVMQELRQELAQVPPGNREQVVRAMIENYKAKAAILERVLERVQGEQQPKTKINNKQDNETETI